MEYVARALGAGMAQIGSVDYVGASRWALSRVFLLVGWAFVLLGVIDLATPLPLGIPLIVLGVTIILNTSPSARKAFVMAGRRYPRTVGRIRGVLRARRRAVHRRRMAAKAA